MTLGENVIKAPRNNENFLQRLPDNVMNSPELSFVVHNGDNGRQSLKLAGPVNYLLASLYIN
jgi:hypothetical protein